MKKTWLYGAVGLLALGAVAAYSQSVPVPQVTQIGGSDLFQDIVGGQPQAQSYYAPAPLLGNYSATLAGNGAENALIGGDATTNLFAYGTTGSSVTTSVTYGGPNRWAYWSGTSTAMTVSQDSTAGDITGPYKYFFKMARTSGQTGVVPVCMMQEIESVNSYAFDGATAELSFYATAGGNFSAASSTMNAYIMYGTGTDDGTNKFAFGLNAGGQGTVGATGQVNFTIPVVITASPNRYGVVANIPTTATELAVALCFTPVGTAGTNDYIAFGGIQLTRNGALSGVAGSTGAALNTNDPRIKSFMRRSQQIETSLQQRYYWNAAEAGTTDFGLGGAVSTTSARYFIPNPTTMRVAPTPTATFGSMTTTGSTGTQINLTALAATSGATTVYGIGLSGTVTLGLTIGNATMLQSNSGVGAVGGNAEL
jgi:hypothetical protein